MNNQMTVGSFLNFGIENAKRHFLKFLGLQIIALVVLGIGAGIAIALAGVINDFGNILGGIIIAFLSLTVSFGFLKNVLNLCRGNKIDFLAFVKVKPMTILSFFLSSILCSIVIAIGLILFVVPGLILSCMLFLVPILVIDKDMGPIEAIKESIVQTKEYKMDIYLGFPVGTLVATLISILTVNPLLLTPMVLFIYVYPYLYLNKQLDEANKLLENNPTEKAS